MHGIPPGLSEAGFSFVRAAVDSTARRVVGVTRQRNALLRAERIKRPPYGWTRDLLLEDELVPYADVVRERYAAWLVQQSHAGALFSGEQRWWLDRIADTTAESAGVSADDLDMAPFTERGGVDGAVRDLGSQVVEILESMNAELTA